MTNVTNNVNISDLINLLPIEDSIYVRYGISLLILILTPIIAKIVLYIFEKYLEPFAKKRTTDIYVKIFNAFKSPTYIISFLVGVYLALWILEFYWIAQLYIVILSIFIILAGSIAYELIPIIINEYGHSLAKKTKTTVDDSMIPIVIKIAKAIIVIIGFLLILKILGIDITPMLAGMGIAGIAVALALQDTLSNMFSGFYLMVDQPFKLRDRILLDSGELCEVMDVSLRSVRLYNIIDNTLVTLPNAEFAKMKIVNLSEPDLKLKVRINIGVAYGSDLEKVKKILLEVANECPDVLETPEPSVFFLEFADFSLNLLLITWIGNLKRTFETKDYINCRINERFIEENIEIPFPIMTLHKK
jgi:small-conductance mechanosensitive channel